MVRFVNIGDQLTDGVNDFAFFDTCVSKFMEFGGEQVFESLEDFALFGSDDPRYERCLGLIPKDRASTEQQVQADSACDEVIPVPVVGAMVFRFGIPTLRRLT